MVHMELVVAEHMYMEWNMNTPISALGSIHNHNVPCAVCYVNSCNIIHDTSKAHMSYRMDRSMMDI